MGTSGRASLEVPEGTLIEGTSRNDGTAEVLKSCGWRWSRNLGAWFVPQSRDQAGQLKITAGLLRTRPKFFCELERTDEDGGPAK